MVGLKDLGLRTGVFASANHLTADEKKTILDKPMKLKAFAVRQGNDGRFGVLLANDGTEEYVFSISNMLLERMEKALRAVGRKESENQDEFWFNEEISASLVQQKSASGRTYYDLI